jgi:hypothetical protein
VTEGVDRNGRPIRVGIVPNGDADTVREIFGRRAAGEGFASIGRDLGMARSSCRRIAHNRAYRGEQSVPVVGRKGQPEVVSNGHDALVTEPEWQAANAVRGRAPVRRGLSEQTELKGLIRCGLCDQRLQVLTYGRDRTKLTYACTRCGGVSVRVDVVDPAVDRALHDAFRAGHPGLLAEARGTERHQKALAAVTAAQENLAAYRDSPEILRELGPKQFAEGLAHYREAVELARRALGKLPPPRPVKRERDLREILRDANRDFIQGVWALPRRADGPRLSVLWTGASEREEVTA